MTEPVTQTVDATLAERGARYGRFVDHARIAQNIKRAMMCRGMDDLPDMHRQALEVIADKIARILNGDPDYLDNWHDIQGYAKLVEDEIAQRDPGHQTQEDANLRAARGIKPDGLIQQPAGGGLPG